MGGCNGVGLLGDSTNDVVHPSLYPRGLQWIVGVFEIFEISTRRMAVAED